MGTVKRKMRARGTGAIPDLPPLGRSPSLPQPPVLSPGERFEHVRVHETLDAAVEAAR